MTFLDQSQSKHTINHAQEVTWKTDKDENNTNDSQDNDQHKQEILHLITFAGLAVWLQNEPLSTATRYLPLRQLVTEVCALVVATVAGTLYNWNEKYIHKTFSKYRTYVWGAMNIDLKIYMLFFTHRIFISLLLFSLTKFFH
jgi:hypothetical protein